MRPVTALLLFASLLPAQQPPPEAPKKARIEGITVSSTGEPVPRVQVRLAGQISVQNGQISQPTVHTATSDDTGKFTIENIDPAANFSLTAQRTGFVTARYGARSATSLNVPLTLSAGQELKGVALTMTPQAVVTGRVTDPNGDPIQSARVMLLRRGYQRGARALVTSSTASTNDQGDFRVANLSPGRYFVMVQSNPSLIGTSGPAPQTASVTTFYPNSPDERGAAPLDLTAGQELRGIDVRMRQGRVYSLKGKALGANGAAAAGTRILSSPKTTGDAASALISAISLNNQTSADGSFEIRGLAPGVYTLSALTLVPVSANSSTSRNSGRMDVTIVDANVTDVVFPLSGGATVTGTIRMEEGDLKALLPPADPNATAQAISLSAAVAAAGLPVTGARPAIALVDTNPSPLGGTQPGPLKDDGTFLIEGAPPGKFQLNVAALPPNTYVKSARFGGTDLIRNPLDLTSGAGGNIEIVLSNKAADITGAVRSEKNESLAGLSISLWTRDPEPGSNNNGVRTTSTDQAGAFQFKGLRPGTYYAAAWEDIDNGLALARDFVTLLTTEAAKLDLAEGAHSAVEVKLVPIVKIKAAEEKLP